MIGMLGLQAIAQAPALLSSKPLAATSNVQVHCPGFREENFMDLAAGILVIVMSILHIVYREKQPIVTLSTATDDTILIGSVRVMSLQGGFLLLSVGLIHILNFLNVITLSGIAVYFPVGVICINLLTFLLVAILKHRELFSIIAFQLVVFAVIIVLQILSIS